MVLFRLPKQVKLVFCGNLNITKMKNEEKILTAIKKRFPELDIQKIAVEINNRLKSYYAYCSLKEIILDILLGDFFVKFSAYHKNIYRLNELEKIYPHPNIFLHVRSIRSLNGIVDW